MKTAPSLLLVLSFLALPLIAQEPIGFAEKFALAENRSEAIKELVPGTEEFYFYSALLAQLEDRLGDVEGILEPWIKRHGESPRVVEIRNRQALLEYGEKPAESLAYLKRVMGLRFEHQRQRLDQKPNFPTELNQDLISYEAFLKRAMRPNSLGDISDRGLDALLRNEVVLNETQRTELLRRLKDADYERLPGLIAAHLRTKQSKGFGEFLVHSRLTLAQLDELLGLHPDLIRDSAFVEAKLKRLRPNEDVSLDLSRQEKRAHLDRVWAFVRDLSPSFNSLKASVLYRQLELEMGEGNYPIDPFIAYLRLPRAIPYMEPRYLNGEVLKGGGADLNADFHASIAYRPVGNDETLVRRYLSHFFVEDDSINRFSPYVRDSYLKQLFAETKLLNGIGDAQQWFSMLTPGQLQALKNRVVISFSPDNPTTFGVDDEVSLSVDLKNVEELIVKVYEINTLNYHLDQKRDINTDLNLDGLVANEEKTVRYELPPIRQHRETFSFDSMTGKRGVWVVELIGNGISSRALVRKGKLQYLSTSSAAGELVRVLTAENKPVKNAAIHFGGKRYTAGENGLVLLPFSEQGDVAIVLEDAGFTTPSRISLPRENYQIALGALLEKETLLAGKEAQIAVRPRITLGGVPVSNELLEEVRLRVETTDLDGIASSSEKKDFAIFDDKESVHSFRVPNRVRTVTVTLSGKMEKISEAGKKQTISSQVVFDVNGVAETNGIADVFLSRFGDVYIGEVLGRSGEPLADRPVSVSLYHPGFTRPFQHRLKSDANGRVDLGSLQGISSLEFTADGVPSRRWPLRDAVASQSSVIHAKAGEKILIPSDRKENAVTRRDLALLEMRGGVPVRDVFAKVKGEPGSYQIDGLEPGDYELLLRGNGEQRIAVRVTESGETDFGYALSESRHLELSNASPPLISGIDSADGSILVKVTNATVRTRVHLVATRFLPDHASLFGSAANTPVYQIDRGSNESAYISGRDIGEEYRYILERRSAKKFPGNMLPRPGLLLNPWELNKTSTDSEDAEAGDEYNKSREMKESKKSSAPPSARGAVQQGLRGVMSTSYSFLAEQAILLPNLAVDENGAAVVPMEDLGDRHFITAFVVDEDTISSRSLALDERNTEFRDIRLRESLDPANTFTQHRHVTLLEEGNALEIADLRSAELQTYSTISDVYRALVAIRSDEDFLKFQFIGNWPSLQDKEKAELYSQYASHELNFFLSKKDPEFFAAVIQPYLKHKKDKTFFDHYLLEHNLERYLAPWEYGRLNIVERILLGRRIGEVEAKNTMSHVRGLQELIPPDPDRSARIYRQALRGLRADAEGVSLGLAFADGAVATASFFSNNHGNAASAPVPAAKPKPEPEAVDAFAAAPVSGGALALQTRTAGRRMLGRAAVADLREEARGQTLYRKLESTKEWAENNYYHLPIEQQIGSLITTNAFWVDFAEWDGKGGFYSREFPEATRSFAEMMLALAVLDLPFTAEEPVIKVEDTQLTYTANSPVVIFHEEIEEAERAEEKTPILVSQNFFRSNDRYVVENGVQIDKFVDDEFLTSVVYGSQVVATNPTSTPRTLELLVQIPEGSVPVGKSDYLKSYPLPLGAFSTSKFEIEFYFPEASGEAPFRIYPVQVAMDEKVIASGNEQQFRVVDKPTQFDEKSWGFLSQFGEEGEVLRYLKTANLHRTDLSRVAWRARENVDFFRQVTKLVSERHGFDPTLWSYGLHHNDLPVMREFLKHREDFVSRCGKWIDCELVTLDPVERHWYQHLEYFPLVNARAHRLGRDRTVLNDRFRDQYAEFLGVISYKPDLSMEDQLSVAAYFFLQDRIEEGLAWQDGIEVASVDSRLQYDYLSAFSALYREDVEKAKEISAAYLEHPVTRWRDRFALVDSQLKELEGAAEEVPVEENREKQLEQLSASDPFFELSAVGREAEISFRNVEEVTVNYYEMDLEFLFSSKPFVSGDSGQFSYIRPNLTENRELPEGGGAFRFPVPEEFANSNVLVEVVANGRTDAVAVYSNQLEVQLSDKYGRIEVRNEESGKPLSKTYVKVYAKMKGGEVKFFKDGYTDLRGKFDYVSLNTDELDRVEELSLLVMSEESGSLVREVKPPQR